MSAGGDIAIVGLAALFPGAAGLEQFWENIVAGVDAIGEPLPEWAGDLYDDPTEEEVAIYCRRGGFLGELSEFDPVPHGVMPRSVDGASPDHFLALRLAHEAMADAGYLDREFPRERTEIILGRGEYFDRGHVTALQHGLMVEQTVRLIARAHPEDTPEQLDELRRQLRASLPPFNGETAPGLVPNLVCGRIANRLDLMGANYTVDAACASSLVALDAGVRELRGGRCDMAIVGGVHASTPPIVFMVFCQLQALSHGGVIRPFDKDADGTLLGEGLGIAILRRLEDAERDGDDIHAVIKGVGLASDGRALGPLAPRVEGEELAMRRAYEDAEVAPATVGLVEAHGTGTQVGDATEVEALRRVFGRRNGGGPWCGLGSVKSMIGHAMPAAGAAGLIKAALALEHGILPPTLHCDSPHPALTGTSFATLDEAQPWIHAGSEPRRAAVSAFGFGGINAHVVLEEHRA